MAPGLFVSHAQNGEDVVLWRALGHVEHGRYVDLGAADPHADSVTKAFYERGWSGLDVEPTDSFAQRLREDRSRDIVVQVVVGEDDHGEATLHEVPGTGLSSVHDEHAAEHRAVGYETRELRVPVRRLDSLVQEHLDGEPVHFLKIDVEGAEAEVLSSVDLSIWRPWVIVVEATRPGSDVQTHEEWEHHVVGAGYRFCLFDGLNRYYVSEEHADLAPALSYPACPLDGHVRAAEMDLIDRLTSLQRQHHGMAVDHERMRSTYVPLQEEVVALRAELVRWRGAALERWAQASVPQRDGRAHRELEELKQTVSWRVTKPLRAVRSRQLRTGP